MPFGECIKSLRLARGLTLRGFTQAAGESASEWSRIERGRIAPPAGDWLRMDRIRQALELTPDSEEWREAVRLSAIEEGRIPPAILSDAEVAAKLPLFFRSLEHGTISDADLDGLVELIRQA